MKKICLCKNSNNYLFNITLKYKDTFFIYLTNSQFFVRHYAAI